MANVFESGARKVIPATLIYVVSNGKVLMLHRNRSERVGDVHLGKYNGLGGKLDEGESFSAGALRELYEEAGIRADEVSLEWRGVLYFPNFKEKLAPKISEDWLVQVFIAHFRGHHPFERVWPCEEGSLRWVDQDQLLTRPLWEGDKEFLPKVFAPAKGGEPLPFSGTFWYRAGELDRFEWS